MKHHISKEPLEDLERQINQLLKSVESFYQASHNSNHRKMREAREQRNLFALKLKEDYKIITRYHSDAAYEEGAQSKPRV
jgi:hypothetical protein|tara:strand:+ start:291 stop:530 length:240 start_codon:yes stop_codon:yes gene_type:complete